MIDLKKLNKELGKALAEVEAASTALDEAVTGGDEDATQVAQDVYDEKTAAFDKMEAKVDEAEKHAKRVALKAKVDAMAQPADPAAAAIQHDGIDGVVGKQAGQAVDPQDVIAAHRNAFTKWIQGDEKLLSGQEQELLKPKSAKVNEILNKSKDKSAAHSVSMPPSLLAKCFGMQYMAAFEMGSKYGDDFMAKTITTINNATTNPSLANLLVPQEFRAQLQMLPLPEALLLDKVTMLPSSTGTVTFPGLTQTTANEFGGVSFSWTEEAGEKPETEPVFNQTEIKCYELCGYTEISERALSRSALSLESILVSLFRPALNYILDRAVMRGTGVGQPTGINVAAGVNAIARQTAGTVSDTDLVNLKHGVAPQHRRGAMFAVHDDVEQALENSNDAQGRPLFRASTANGPYDRLVGYPYGVTLQLPTIGNSGDVLFGDMRQYYLVMEEEVTIAKSEHFKFQNNVVAFKVFLVVGGLPMHPRAFAKLDDASS